MLHLQFPGQAPVLPVRLDLSSRKSIDECCGELADLIDSVDLLVNNAGMLTGGLLEDQDTDAFYAMFQVNLIAVAHMTQRVLPGMLRRGRGKVVNNASISSASNSAISSSSAAPSTPNRAMRRR